MLQRMASITGWSAIFYGVGLLWWMAQIACRCRSRSAMMQHIQPSYRFVFTSSCEMTNHNTELSWSLPLHCKSCAISPKVLPCTWVTAMSMTSEKLQPWETLRHHPCVEVKTAKRPLTRSQADLSKRLSLTPVVGKTAQSEASNKSVAGTCTQGRQSLNPTLHAPWGLTWLLLFKMGWALKVLLSKLLQSSSLEAYKLYMQWGLAGQCSMPSRVISHLQCYKFPKAFGWLNCL